MGAAAWAVLDWSVSETTGRLQSYSSISSSASCSERTENALGQQLLASCATGRNRKGRVDLNIWCKKLCLTGSLPCITLSYETCQPHHAGPLWGPFCQWGLLERVRVYIMMMMMCVLNALTHTVIPTDVWFFRTFRDLHLHMRGHGWMRGELGRSRDLTLLWPTS